MLNKVSGSEIKKTLLWMSVSGEPFLVLYSLMPFFLRSDLGATYFQLSVYAAIKPCISLLSFYLSSFFTNSKLSQEKILLVTWFVARVLFVFLPCFKSPWYVIFCSATYELFHRAGNPAIIQILNSNMLSSDRNRFYNFLYVVNFIESALLGILATAALNKDLLSWDIMLTIAVSFSLSSLILQFSLVRGNLISLKNSSQNPKKISPLRDALDLLKNNYDYLRFQGGFMLGGIGLMLISPGLAVYFSDYLKLSYGEIAAGRSVFMGIGVAISSLFWHKLMTRQRIEAFLKVVLIGFSLYCLLLYFSSHIKGLFYLAFFIYGVSQAGSHLLWNLSGPYFSNTQESLLYSQVNILMVGLRGMIIPFIGGLIGSYFGPSVPLILGFSFCVLGLLFLKFSSQQSSILFNDLRLKKPQDLIKVLR